MAATCALLYCPPCGGDRQHVYAGTIWHAANEHYPGRAELVYQCRICQFRRLLGVLVVCGPRAASEERKRERGRPRRVRL